MKENKGECIVYAPYGRNRRLSPCGQGHLLYGTKAGESLPDLHPDEIEQLKKNMHDTRGKQKGNP